MTEVNTGKLSPMIQQYLKIHESVPDAFLMFRVGDFYEMFFDDAVKASKILDLVLTGKDCGLDERAPMCGVPYHAVDSYVSRLVDKGYKVAICDQMSDPKVSKGLVEREITRIVTSGTVTDSSFIKEDENNFLMCIYYNKLSFGVSYCDITTGEVICQKIDGTDAEDRFYNLLSAVSPAEIIVNGVLYQSQDIKDKAELITGRPLTLLSSSEFAYDRCSSEILEQLSVYSMDAAGIEECDEMIRSCGALFLYLRQTQKNALKHINAIRTVNDRGVMNLDYATKRNLELSRTLRGAQKKGSLLWVLDKTATNVGGRTLAGWINEPLIDKNSILRRLDALSELTSDIMRLEDIQYYLKRTGDIQRLCSKIAMHTANGRDLLSLKETASLIPKIKDLMKGVSYGLLADLRDGTDDLADIYGLIDSAINEDCTADIRDSNTIKPGYSKEADEAREFRLNSRAVLAELEQKEKDATGIKNLKIKYNKVFGYYFEVSKSNLSSVPDYFVRKQTLVNAERFYTEELKNIEQKILTSQEESERIEVELFNEINDRILGEVVRIQKSAENIGILDALCSLAYVSVKYHYVRPSINDVGVIKVRDSRHPVIERINEDIPFIPNDIELNLTDSRLNIITGPNMAGKSTYIRQCALLSIMFQIGCFLPCESADMCIVDRIFTRVGASDNLAAGQSTFMVEMSEVANILRHATSDSLVILDEVGRGTSTLDGLSIARAVAEFLLDRELIGCKTLFATHYHELTQMGEIEGVKNLHIDIAETGGSVVFLHKIKPGAADKSYGIEVARLAGLPDPVIERSEDILEMLEASEEPKGKKISSKKKKTGTVAVEAGSNLLNYIERNLKDEIASLPLEEMSPMEVFNYIAKIQKDLKSN
ncbi:MAG: DNA mismatch repair protein MutS [Eubacteriaceae bacterium]|nr:DNA mismatch repair protein MutS [Eubacteriaceae bacterium]